MGKASYFFSCRAEFRSAVRIYGVRALVLPAALQETDRSRMNFCERYSDRGVVIPAAASCGVDQHAGREGMSVPAGEGEPTTSRPGPSRPTGPRVMAWRRFTSALESEMEEGPAIGRAIAFARLGVTPHGGTQSDPIQVATRGSFPGAADCLTLCSLWNLRVIACRHAAAHPHAGASS